MGGVGILLFPRASSNLLNIEKITDLIVVAEINCNPKARVVSCYSPTNISDESSIDAFYQDLKSLLDNSPAHNFIVVPGNFNAQIGPEDVLFTFNKATNHNGEKLVDLARYQLTMTNTRSVKPLKKAMDVPTSSWTSYPD